MKLSQEDTELFFRLMWGLQFYINQQRQILTDIALYGTKIHNILIMLI